MNEVNGYIECTLNYECENCNEPEQEEIDADFNKGFEIVTCRYCGVEIKVNY